MIGKRVLLYATKFMNIYLDIKNCLEKMGYEVLWIEANTIPNNPYNKTLGLYNKSNIEEYQLKASYKWKRLLEDEIFTRPFDYFISIVGIDIPQNAFEELSRYNPKMRKVLYLYDRVEGVYQIDCFFKYYDEVFSFDRGDCKQFNLPLLPIYWIPIPDALFETKYDIFAFASYSELKQERTVLFSNLKKIAKHYHYKEFIKLYDKSFGVNKIGFVAKSLAKFILKKNSLTLRDIFDGLITGTAVMPEEYRRLINQSRVVFDTQASYQDGLTARFMWALGAGKKIITTNPHVRDYNFYNEEQFFVLDQDDKEIEEFVKKPFSASVSQQKLIEPYRIDNWLNTLLNIT